MEVNAINTALKSNPNKRQIQALLNKKEFEDKKSVPSGLMEDVFSRSKKSIYDVEVRDTLEKAVRDAHLNVTERMALNETFFPKGGGFELFPDNIYEYESTLYYNPLVPPENDEFLTKALHMSIPDSVCTHKYILKEGKKSSLTLNLETALAKLKTVLKK